MFVFTGQLFYKLSLSIVNKTNFYPLKKIQIIGLKAINPYEITKISSLKKGTNLLTIDKIEVKKKIKQIARVKFVEVTSLYPDSIIIRIEEKNVDFIVRTKNDLFGINLAGELVSNKQSIVDFDKFFIELPEISKEEEIESNKQIKDFLKLYANIPNKEKDLFNIYSSIHFNGEVLFYTKEENIKVNLGLDISLEKIRKARYAYLYYKEKKLKTKLIDLRFNLVKYAL